MELQNNLQSNDGFGKSQELNHRHDSVSLSEKERNSKGGSEVSKLVTYDLLRMLTRS